VCLSGSFGTMPLTAGEASKWLRSLLGLKYDVNDSHSKISSHSLKRTLLSWCSKYGMPREDRAILGYHVQPGVSTLMHYSRDEQAAPLRKAHAMLDDIRSGLFDPDNTRSGMLSKPRISGSSNIMMPSAKCKAADVGSRRVSNSDDDHSSTSGESSSSSSDSDDNELSDNEDLGGSSDDETSKKRKIQPAKSKSTSFAIHVRWKTLHRVVGSESRKLACGREFGSAYSYLSEVPKFCYHSCVTCFGSDATEQAL